MSKINFVYNRGPGNDVTLHLPEVPFLALRRPWLVLVPRTDVLAFLLHKDILTQRWNNINTKCPLYREKKSILPYCKEIGRGKENKKSYRNMPQQEQRWNNINTGKTNNAESWIEIWESIRVQEIHGFKACCSPEFSHFHYCDISVVILKNIVLVLDFH